MSRGMGLRTPDTQGCHKHFPSGGALPNPALLTPPRVENCRYPQTTADRLAHGERTPVKWTVSSYKSSLARWPLTSWGHFSPDGRWSPTVTDQGGPGAGESPASRPVRVAPGGSRRCWGFPHPAAGGSCRDGQVLPNTRPLSEGTPPSVR